MKRGILAAFLVVTGMAVTGCATKGDIRKELAIAEDTIKKNYTEQVADEKAAREKQIQSLQSTIEEQNAQLASMQELLTTLDSRNKQLDRTIVSLEEENSALKAEFANAKDAMDQEITSRLSQAGQNMADFVKDVNTFSTDLDTVKQMTASNQSNLKTLEGTVQQLRSDSQKGDTDLQQNLDDMHKQVSAKFLTLETDHSKRFDAINRDHTNLQLSIRSVFLEQRDAWEAVATRYRRSIEQITRTGGGSDMGSSSSEVQEMSTGSNASGEGTDGGTD